MKTIKQISDHLGVSKDKVKYRVKQLPAEWVTTEGNITYINADGERLIYALLGNKSGKKESVTHEDSPVNGKLPTEKSDRIEALELRIIELEKQIESERASHAGEKLAMQKKYSEDIMELTNKLTESSDKFLRLIDQEQKLNAMNKQLPAPAERKLFGLFRRKSN